MSAGVYSLAHGGNDAQKTMGIIVALLVAAGLDGWVSWGHVPDLHLLGEGGTIGLPIILSCHAAIALGTMFGRLANREDDGLWHHKAATGRRILRRKRGGRDHHLRPRSTRFRSQRRTPSPGRSWGVGVTKSVRSVHWIWGQRIIMAWILTIPCSAFIAAITYIVVHHTIERWLF